MQIKYLLTSTNSSPFSVGHRLLSCRAEHTDPREDCDVEFDLVCMLECIQATEIALQA